MQIGRPFYNIGGLVKVTFFFSKSFFIFFFAKLHSRCFKGAWEKMKVGKLGAIRTEISSPRMSRNYSLGKIKKGKNHHRVSSLFPGKYPN